MRDLIERLERADGPSRGLFEEVFLTLNPNNGNDLSWDALAYRFDILLEAEAWESAALMLVPEGWIVQAVRAFDDDGEFFATVTLIDSFSVRRGSDPEDERSVSVSKAARRSFQDPTAIAMCIAALRAKEADNG